MNIHHIHTLLPYEPGGHLDHYYWQMIANIRRYKGAAKLPEPRGVKTIDIDADFDQWNDVVSEYRDHVGETIPRERVERSVSALLDSDALLVIGSSLMVYSGFRFCRLANEHGIPIAAINPGRTRADDLIGLKLEEPFEKVIPALAALG